MSNKEVDDPLCAGLSWNNAAFRRIAACLLTGVFGSCVAPIKSLDPPGVVFL